jgi:hypothetical protein
VSVDRGGGPRGAVEVEAALHPADMTAIQAPEIAATTCLRRTRTSPCTPIPWGRPADPKRCTRSSERASNRTAFRSRATHLDSLHPRLLKFFS